MSAMHTTSITLQVALNSSLPSPPLSATIETVNEAGRHHELSTALLTLPNGTDMQKEGKGETIELVQKEGEEQVIMGDNQGSVVSTNDEEEDDCKSSSGITSILLS